MNDDIPSAVALDTDTNVGAGIWPQQKSPLPFDRGQ